MSTHMHDFNKPHLVLHSNLRKQVDYKILLSTIFEHVKGNMENYKCALGYIRLSLPLFAKLL